MVLEEKINLADSLFLRYPWAKSFVLSLLKATAQTNLTKMIKSLIDELRDERLTGWRQVCDILSQVFRVIIIFNIVHKGPGIKYRLNIMTFITVINKWRKSIVAGTRKRREDEKVETVRASSCSLSKFATGKYWEGASNGKNQAQVQEKEPWAAPRHTQLKSQVEIYYLCLVANDIIPEP